MGRFRWRSGHKVEGSARGRRGSVVAVAFSVLVLTGLAAGGAIGTAAAMAGHSTVSVQPCPQCTLAANAVSRSLSDSQRLVAQTRALAMRISKHPTAKSGINKALSQATQVAVQARSLLKQAALTNNAADRLRLINAARVEAGGVKDLATLAHTYALAALKLEGRR